MDRNTDGKLLSGRKTVKNNGRKTWRKRKNSGWCRRSGRIFPVSPCGWEVSPVAVRVMRNRGLTEEAEMKKYLYGTLDDLYDPRLMKGMEQAAELIVRKLKEGKHVRIIGDYDIDGVCSTYILLKGFAAGGKRTIAAVLIGGRPIQRRERK